MMHGTVTDFGKIGKYEVVEQAGKGSFGIVYKGRDPFLKREVAIKVCTVEDEEFRKRFFREAEIAGKLQHKNIVTVFAFGFEGDAPYLVQEFLTGKDLRQFIQEGAEIAVADKVDFLIQIAEGLEHAHAQGVVHRDIKPANVRLLRDGVVKILDFGIAKLAGAETQLTQAGVTLGTATYLSPEQVRGSEVDPRADQFSFGVLAYELLTCRRPFQGNTLSALVYQILYKPPVAMARAWAGCPEPLAQIVERCLEKEPDRRYRDAGELAAALRAVRDEIVAGQWPVAGEKVAPPEPAGGGRSAPDPSEATASLRASRSQTIRVDVVPTHSPAAPEKTAGDATQPIPILSLEDGDVQAAEVTVPAAPPPAAPPPAAPPPAAPPPAAPEATVAGAAASPREVRGRDQEKTVKLSMSAQEIGDLVAQGDLEAARRQLDATIQQQAAGTHAEKASGVPEPAVAPPPLPASVDAEAHPPAATGRRQLQLPAALTKLPATTRWGILAAAALVMVVILALLLRSPDEEPVVEAPPVAPPPVQEVAAPAPVVYTATINALPWARITEIVNLENGSLQELPELFHTPVALELEEGSYRVSLENPDAPDAEVTFCEIVVGPETGPGEEAGIAGEGEAEDGDEVELDGAACNVVFKKSTALEYFKETGWWR